VASAIGADAGWGIDDIDDLKLALSEMLSIIGAREGVSRLCVGFVAHDDEVTVHVKVDPPIGLLPPDGLGAVILAAVMDDVDWRPDGTTLRKRRSELPAEVNLLRTGNP
jgi:anti-sigma regulatory factor (Ser/Thr protein kinase)